MKAKVHPQRLQANFVRHRRCFQHEDIIFVKIARVRAQDYCVWRAEKMHIMFKYQMALQGWLRASGCVARRGKMNVGREPS